MPDKLLFDCHSHYPSRQGEWVVQQGVNSVGIHPWEVYDLFKTYVDNVGTSSSARWTPAMEEALDELMNSLVYKLQAPEGKHIIAIGECGMDKLCTSPLPWQEEVFKSQVELSEQYHLPLIIHGVKAQEELVRLKRQLAPRQPWVWHGFRGKPQQMEQLLRAGFYISFGFRYNAASLATCPPEYCLFESDDDARPVTQYTLTRVVERVYPKWTALQSVSTGT